MPASTLTETDRAHLRRALELAEGGRGRVSPNPLVGAVLVDGGEVVAEGHHAELGGLHAEAAALAAARDAGHEPGGATLYVSLEPCAHHGRQPPCAEALRDAGVARVVIGSDDPSEKASGAGPRLLRAAGVVVDLADRAEAEAARLLNQPFRKHARAGRPLVALKSALTLDGRTASATGDARWISGAESRALVHRWRAEFDAIAVGVGTALADDPLLTARDVPDLTPRQPLRVVFDSAARLPVESRLVGSVGEAPLTVVAAPWAPAERTAALERAGAEVLGVAGAGPERVVAALDALGGRGITSLLLEGGAGLAGSFRDAGEIDELRLFVAPLVLGGAGARTLIAGEGAGTVAEAERALAMEWERSGDDLLVRARLREW